MLNRHNMRPNHLHMMIEAPGYKKLTTAFYPEGDPYLASDAVFGVKRSLVVVSSAILVAVSPFGAHELAFAVIEGSFGRC